MAALLGYWFIINPHTTPPKSNLNITSQVNYPTTYIINYSKLFRFLSIASVYRTNSIVFLKIINLLHTPTQALKFVILYNYVTKECVQDEIDIF